MSKALKAHERAEATGVPGRRPPPLREHRTGSRWDMGPPRTGDGQPQSLSTVAVTAPVHPTSPPGRAPAIMDGHTRMRNSSVTVDSCQPHAWSAPINKRLNALVILPSTTKKPLFLTADAKAWGRVPRGPRDPRGGLRSPHCFPCNARVLSALLFFPHGGTVECSRNHNRLRVRTGYGNPAAFYQARHHRDGQKC